MVSNIEHDEHVVELSLDTDACEYVPPSPNSAYGDSENDIDEDI